jgi:hypothetical protein
MILVYWFPFMYLGWHCEVRIVEWLFGLKWESLNLPLSAMTIKDTCSWKSLAAVEAVLLIVVCLRSPKRRRT